MPSLRDRDRDGYTELASTRQSQLHLRQALTLYRLSGALAERATQPICGPGQRNLDQRR